MHIPSGASQTVELLSFETALTLSGQGDSYDRSRWLYVPDFYTEYRYILGTIGANPLICIGVNPSTAEPATPSARPGPTTWTARSMSACIGKTWRLSAMSFPAWTQAAAPRSGRPGAR